MRNHLFKEHFVAAAFIVACGISRSQAAPSATADTKPDLPATLASVQSTTPRRMTDYRDVLDAMNCSDLEVAAIQNGRASLPDEWARNWAGVYTDYGFSTTERELYLLPETGAIFYSQGCSLVCYQIGHVSESFPDGVRTRFSSDFCRSVIQPSFSDWYFFEWGGQRCCLQLEQIINLIHALNVTPMNEFEDIRRHVAITSRLKELGRDESESYDDICGSPIFPEIFSDLVVREPLVIQVHSIDPGERLLQASDPRASSLRQFTAHLDILEGTLSVGRRLTVPGSELWSAGIFTVESISTDSKRVSGTLEILAVTPGYNAPPRHGTILRYPGSPPK